MARSRNAVRMITLKMSIAVWRRSMMKMMLTLSLADIRFRPVDGVGSPRL